MIYPIVLEKRLELIISLPHHTVTTFNKAIQKGRSDLEDTSYLETAQRLYN